MLNSTATKILVDANSNTKQIRGVEFIYKNKKYTVRAKKEVIVSGGAVNSPQLLLLSGIGPRSELQKIAIPVVHDLPGVGKNLHNHVTFYLDFLLKKEKAFNDLDWEVLTEYLLFKKGPMSSTGMSQLTARINTKYADPSGRHPDLQIFFAGYAPKCSKTGEARAPEDPNDINMPKHLTVSPVVLHPKSRGALTLKSRNPLDPPSMVANYLKEPEDVAILIEGIRVIQRLANTTVLKQKYGIEFNKESYGNCEQLHRYDSDAYWDCAVRYYTGAENHQAGSCKMGPASDPMAVVDPELQVHGVQGLRVMDASIMPTLVSGNTHATCVMIAEKGVQFIREKYRPNLPNRFGGNLNNPFPSHGPQKFNYSSIKDPHSAFPNKRPSYPGIPHPIGISPGPPGNQYPPFPNRQYNNYHQYQYPSQKNFSNSSPFINSYGNRQQRYNNQYDIKGQQ
ncbi:hypothetical protein HHI36_001751 [Cryptolaemus montrouzieri]|uniref:Glucose-methanol-choline oxidoreductase N-terminal domain-containing protein n=1 Tax=Cryptolaemus montrouzieri TaxID=559131 RepID=A0ABD2P8V3_9CUCU